MGQEFMMIRKANEAYTGTEIYSLNTGSPYRWACSGIESRHVGWTQYTVYRKCAQEQTLKYLRSQSKGRGISKGNEMHTSDLEKLFIADVCTKALPNPTFHALVRLMLLECQVMLDIRT